jgi:hypothetical protein
MPNYTHTPSTPAIERLPRILESTPTMLCLSCGDTMKHSRTIAQLRARAQQFIFVCPSCNGIDTREANRLA